MSTQVASQREREVAVMRERKGGEMADGIDTRKNAAEGVPHDEGRLSGGRSGQYGVTDERRAQLAQMEQDAGVQHEAADEGSDVLAKRTPEAAIGLERRPAAARPGDLH